MVIVSTSIIPAYQTDTDREKSRNVPSELDNSNLDLFIY